MRRQDIQLLVSARQGDTAARCEVGRRYLLGVDGFPHHVASGIEHLTHASVKDLPQAARIVAEHLSLESLIELQLERSLERAAAAGSQVAQLKLAVVLQVLQQRPAEALRVLRTAVYGTVAKVSNKGLANFAVASAPAFAAGQDSTGYELGLRHSF